MGAKLPKIEHFGRIWGHFLWVVYVIFQNFDVVSPAIILISFSEICSSDKKNLKIILNDYIEISKSFVTTKETKLINLILDKLLSEKK